MIKSILGGQSAEQVLLYLQSYNEGYATGIAKTFDANLYAIQNQLIKLEDSGVLVSQLKGRTRLYTWNPRYPLNEELRQLLAKAISLIPAEEKKRYFYQRTRPRRKNKPLSLELVKQ